MAALLLMVGVGALLLALGPLRALIAALPGCNEDFVFV